MPPQPYIGITGFAHRDEVLLMVNALPNTDRLIMVGVGVRDYQYNRGPNRYPTAANLGQIFVKHPQALNLLHVHTERRAELLEDMFLLRGLAGPHCHGFQLNMAWPDQKVLDEYRSEFPGDTIVLACDRSAFRKVLGSCKNLAQRLRDYDGLIDYVAIDKSGGTGKELDSSFLLHCFDQIAVVLPDLGLVATGGLYSENVESRLSPILPLHACSSDAEGKLRTKDDLLDIAESIRYVQAIDALFRRFEEVRVQS